MTLLPETGRRSGRFLKIVSVNPGEQRKRMRDAIARKAYEICECRNFDPGHELEDWQRAESAILLPLNCGFLMLDDKLALSTDAKPFEKTEIEIRVEPKRLTICSEEPRRANAKPATDALRSNRNLTFHFVNLPIEIDPSRVTARFKGRALEIDLPKAQSAQKPQAAANAA